MNSRMILMLSLVALAAIIIIQNMLSESIIYILFIQIKMPLFILGVLLLFIGYALAVVMNKKKKE